MSSHSRPYLQESWGLWLKLIKVHSFAGWTQTAHCLWHPGTGEDKWDWQEEFFLPPKRSEQKIYFKDHPQIEALQTDVLILTCSVQLHNGWNITVDCLPSIAAQVHGSICVTFWFSSFGTLLCLRNSVVCQCMLMQQNSSAPSVSAHSWLVTLS